MVHQTMSFAGGMLYVTEVTNSVSTSLHIICLRPDDGGYSNEFKCLCVAGYHVLKPRVSPKVVH